MKRVRVRDAQRPRAKVFAIVDDRDFAKVSRRTWTLQRGFVVGSVQHPRRRRARGDKVTVRIGLHRFVLGLAPGAAGRLRWRNGDRLDNRRSNLVRVTRQRRRRRRVVVAWKGWDRWD